MSESGNQKKSNDGRWWEFYFVRYFVGTVVGGAILLYLNASKTSSLNDLIIPGVTDVSTLNAQFLSLLVAIGLAYCYVASAPILVLHATRGAFLEDNKKYKWTFWISYVLSVAGGAVVFGLPGALLAVILSLQVVPISFSLYNKGKSAHDYYVRLTKARSKDSEEARQYVESYKHLREHGNAFFILILELMLGVILASAPDANTALLILFIWISPAVSVWFIGTLLEYRFSGPPKP